MIRFLENETIQFTDSALNVVTCRHGTNCKSWLRKTLILHAICFIGCLLSTSLQVGQTVCAPMSKTFGLGVDCKTGTGTNDKTSHAYALEKKHTKNQSFVIVVLRIICRFKDLPYKKLKRQIYLSIYR